MKMKATVIHKFGDVDVLKREDIERPSPKPGHVLIKVLIIISVKDQLCRNCHSLIY